MSIALTPLLDAANHAMAWMQRAPHQRDCARGCICGRDGIVVRLSEACIQVESERRAAVPPFPDREVPMGSEPQACRDAYEMGHVG